METLRSLNIKYLSQYLEPRDAKDIEAYVFDKTSNEHEYKRKARLFLASLQRKSWSKGDLNNLTAFDLHLKRWAPFQSAEEFVETTTAEQHKPTATTMYTCGKCKKNECTFYEMQTRGGDEGSTTFITCINCGHKWKQ